MNTEKQILGLSKLGNYIKDFLQKNQENFNDNDEQFITLLNKSQIENPWFTEENLNFSLQNWANLLNEENIKN